MLDLKGNTITYYGHSTFALTTPSGQLALIDPWVMTNPNCPDALTAKQHKPKIVATFETYLWLESKSTGAQCLPANKGGSRKVGDFAATASMLHPAYKSPQSVSCPQIWLCPPRDKR
jgi:L-ascorbate metabolism protein UlaG (beta-lactamase superfamily)